MDEKSLYDAQYQGALRHRVTFRGLRKIFPKLDLTREDVAMDFLPGGVNFLDFGCGNGNFVFKVLAKYSQVYGVDLSTVRIQDALKAVLSLDRKADIHFSEVVPGGKLGFQDNLFDAVTLLAVIEHVFDPFETLKEIHRVLKPGGVLVAEVPNIAYLKYRVQLLFGVLPVTSSPYNWKEIGWDGGHLHYFTKKSFCWLLEESGFKIENVSGAGLFASLRNFYPALLTGDICVKAVKK